MQNKHRNQSSGQHRSTRSASGSGSQSDFRGGSQGYGGRESQYGQGYGRTGQDYGSQFSGASQGYGDRDYGQQKTPQSYRGSQWNEDSDYGRWGSGNQDAQ